MTAIKLSKMYIFRKSSVGVIHKKLDLFFFIVFITLIRNRKLFFFFLNSIISHGGHYVRPRYSSTRHGGYNECLSAYILTNDPSYDECFFLALGQDRYGLIDYV